jgi:hypothetical protein
MGSEGSTTTTLRSVAIAVSAKEDCANHRLVSGAPSASFAPVETVGASPGRVPQLELDAVGRAARSALRAPSARVEAQQHMIAGRDAHDRISDGADDARSLVAEDDRIDLLRQLRVPQQQVGVAHARCDDVDQDLVRTRLTDLDVFDPEGLVRALRTAARVIRGSPGGA